MKMKTPIRKSKKAIKSQSNQSNFNIAVVVAFVVLAACIAVLVAYIIILDDNNVTNTDTLMSEIEALKAEKLEK